MGLPSDALQVRFSGIQKCLYCMAYACMRIHDLISMRMQA